MGFFAKRRQRQTNLILTALLEEREQPHTGLTVMRATKLGPGTFYPIVQRLIQGSLVTRTRDDVPRDPERPARYFYTLTGAGRLAAEAARLEG